MNVSTTRQRQAKQENVWQTAMVTAFWEATAKRSLLKDSERLLQIKKGFSADLFQVVRVTFDLPERSFETLFDVSISTLRRRGREQMPLDTIASERLDRIRDLSLGAQSL